MSIEIEFSDYTNPFDKYDASQIGVIVLAHSESLTIDNPSSYEYLNQVRWFFINPNSDSSSISV